jgi:hypothetical protein
MNQHKWLSCDRRTAGMNESGRRVDQPATSITPQHLADIGEKMKGCQIANDKPELGGAGNVGSWAILPQFGG